jgi:large subunit ribosomal protein L23
MTKLGMKNDIHLFDIIKYPLLTDKTTKLLELNQYTFAVNPKASKDLIKLAVEKLFEVSVVSVNTSMSKVKRRRVGRYIGTRSQYKRAIVTISENDSIKLFS